MHIGDFVETKNAVLGAAPRRTTSPTSAMPRSAATSNIGAGTITCNYDGFDKHRTVIGDRVQVGSDSTLVAPVRLGDDCLRRHRHHRAPRRSRGALVFNPRDQDERPRLGRGLPRPQDRYGRSRRRKTQAPSRHAVRGNAKGAQQAREAKRAPRGRKSSLAVPSG